MVTAGDGGTHTSMILRPASRCGDASAASDNGRLRKDQKGAIPQPGI